jgi:hypothetical protein
MFGYLLLFSVFFKRVFGFYEVDFVGLVTCASLRACVLVPRVSSIKRNHCLFGSLKFLVSTVFVAMADQFPNQ